MAKVYLINDGTEAFEGRWDSKDYAIDPDHFIEVDEGVANHWIERNPDVGLRIEEIPPAEVEKRNPGNPIESINRGTAFSALKKNTKPPAEK